MDNFNRVRADEWERWEANRIAARKKAAKRARRWEILSGFMYIIAGILYGLFYSAVFLAGIYVAHHFVVKYW